ncbi:MAG: NADH-quinone oxidoreductase subunit C [Clostridia bacterium]|nr:NADH-quinone oxidoreductase subunit C [Clostridia bacterium]
MMYENQTIDVRVDELVDKAVLMKGQGYRLVQISCTFKDGFEINYSFDKDYQMINYRIQVDTETEILSISHIFFPAFLYENEMKDLFGVKIKDISIDYQGNLYRVAQKTPFNPQRKEEA